MILPILLALSLDRPFRVCAEVQGETRTMGAYWEASTAVKRAMQLVRDGVEVSAPVFEVVSVNRAWVEVVVEGQEACQRA